MLSYFMLMEVVNSRNWSCEIWTMLLDDSLDLYHNEQKFWIPWLCIVPDTTCNCNQVDNWCGICWQGIRHVYKVKYPVVILGNQLVPTLAARYSVHL